jgi:hypothetical protein
MRSRQVEVMGTQGCGGFPRLIHHGTPAPLTGMVAHTTDTRRKTSIRRARVCVRAATSVKN